VFLKTPESQMKTPVKSSFKKGTKNDLYLEDSPDINERSSDRSLNKLSPPKEFHGETSYTKSTTLNEVDSHAQLTLKYSNSPSRQYTAKDKKRRKLRKNLNFSLEDKTYKLVSDKCKKTLHSALLYCLDAKDVNLDKEVEKMDFNDEDEVKYIAMLNRNIKKSHQEMIRKSTTALELRTKDESKFIDIDEYFSRVMQHKIKEKDHNKIHPAEFKRFKWFFYKEINFSLGL